MLRISRDEYYMKMAELTSRRGTCPRLKVGCVAVKDRRILSLGCNGSVPGEDHCIDVGCLMVNGHCVRSVHAEQNLIITATINGVSLVGSTVYVTSQPCHNCLKLLASCGVKKIWYGKDYENPKETAKDYWKIGNKIGLQKYSPNNRN